MKPNVKYCYDGRYLVCTHLDCLSEAYKRKRLGPILQRVPNLSKRWASFQLGSGMGPIAGLTEDGYACREHALELGLITEAELVQLVLSELP